MKALGLVGDGDEIATEERLVAAHKLPTDLDLCLELREEALLEHLRRGNALYELRHDALLARTDLDHVPHAPHHPSPRRTLESSRRLSPKEKGNAGVSLMASPRVPCGMCGKHGLTEAQA